MLVPQRFVASPPLVAAPNTEAPQQFQNRAGPPRGLPRQPTSAMRRTTRHAHPEPAHMPDRAGHPQPGRTRGARARRNRSFTSAGPIRG
eukprot:11142583-Alexandrium_andersonii.AAC.1